MVWSIGTRINSLWKQLNLLIRATRQRSQWSHIAEEVKIMMTAQSFGSFLRFDGNSCQIQLVGVTQEPPGMLRAASIVIVTSRIIALMLKGYSLPGMLPPQLV